MRFNNIKLICVTKELWSYFSIDLRSKTLSLLILIIIGSFTESLSLGIVVPYLAFLNNPYSLSDNYFFKTFSHAFGFLGSDYTIQFITLLLIVFVLATAYLRYFVYKSLVSLAANLGSDLSIKVFSNSLSKPYLEHKSTNSSDLIAVITANTDDTMMFVVSLLQIISSSVLSISIIIAFLVISFKFTLFIALLLLITYAFIGTSYKGKLKSNGLKITQNRRVQIKSLQEGLGAIRDIILCNSQAVYINSYSLADRSLRRSFKKNLVIGVTPKYLLEPIVLSFVLIACFLITISKTGGLSTYLPIIAGLALGAQRLLPTLQNIFQSWASCSSKTPAVENVLSMLSVNHETLSGKTILPYKLENNISLNLLSFKYPLSTTSAFENLNLKIRKGQKIGLIGASGGGKSTLMDLMMGLLAPTSGTIIVDSNFDINGSHESIISWRKSIAHVPQTIYLCDSSILSNIAFGIDSSQIDVDLVYESAKKAQIYEYIQTLPDKFNTIVGERGVRLSGGQRQRLGIARALYKKVQVLFLDEATSALDPETESNILDELSKLNRDLTIISVAHRISSLKNCDFVYSLDKGDLSLVSESE